MRARLVIGVDAGATTTRCVVATLDGRVVGRGRAGGANQRSSAGDPADALAAALRTALSGVDSARVALGVVGMAGAGAAGHVAAQAAATTAWRRLGLSGGVHVLPDLDVAYAAGTAAPTGLLLVAGTGAVAAAYRDGVRVHRCDGYGWLLGDEGSAVWIGRAAVRAVLAALDGRAAPTALTGPVIAQLAPAPEAPRDPDQQAQALVAAAYAVPPAELGRLAPAVSRIAAAGDTAARRITDDAAGRLLHALDTVARHATGPVVLAGSVLLAAGPVADAVHHGVRERGLDALTARDGAAGAAAIAVGRLRGGPVPAEAHARLTGAPPPTGAQPPTAAPPPTGAQPPEPG